MSGACRASFQLKFWRRWLFSRRAWRYHYDLILKDNVAWVICALRGHRPYNTNCLDEPPEHACSYCGEWLRELDPQEWMCQRHQHIYQLPGSCPACCADVRQIKAAMAKAEGG